MGLEPKTERRIPTAWVLGVVSLMLSAGFVAVLTSGKHEQAPAPPPPTFPPTPVLLAARTPEEVAETFLDAWRKRDYATARALAAGQALLRVEDREQARESLAPGDREIESVWNRLADARLRFVAREREPHPDGRLTLRGQAEGEFAGRPYRRQMEFVLGTRETRWVVEEMHPGPILTELPKIFEIETPPDRDPGAIKMRGEPVP